MIKTLSCQMCERVFTSSKVNTKFCSNACRSKHYKRDYQINEPDSIAPGVRGALSELLVCADLLSKGYEVFRSVSPSCSCDLLAYRDGRVFRVEVKTVTQDIYAAGLIPNHLLNQSHKFDVFSGVTRGGDIFYFPSFD